MAPNEQVSLVDYKVAGYEVDLCTPVTEGFYCPLCKLLMRNPVQTCRGELACESCYKQAKRLSGVCPIDNQPIEINQLFRDKFKGNAILQLRCYCGNRKYGCQWKGSIAEVEEHERTCKCIPIQCTFCQVEISQSEVVSHLDVCEKLLSKGRCFYEGCAFKPQSGSDLKAHLETNAVLHAALHASMVSDLRLQLTNQIEAHNKQAKDGEAKTQNEMKNLKGEFALLMKSMADMQLRQNNNIDKLQSQIEEMQKQPKTDVSAANNDAHLVLTDGLTSKINDLSKTVSSLDLRQQLSENTSYDGKLLWKIDNVSKRFNQAVIGKVTALHSAPTFTSRYGYKFCGRLYLNGDGIGKGTHASMFFVLMKSEYDSLLEWPFNKRITMRLVNQRDRKEDLVECFDTDLNSSSFLKPQKDMNVASGCPLFVAKDNLLNGGFIKDDIMYVELNLS